MKERCIAIVLAAGQGKRMQSDVQKQYMEMCGYPVIYYALRTFEESHIIDDVILVVGSGEEEYCQKEIVERFSFGKVRTIVEGGKERYHSVWNGLQEADKMMSEESRKGYVFIHDGARPFITEEIVARSFEAVKQYDSVVVGMPSKDTIKIVDQEGMASTTPNRNYVWAVQTPQVFECQLIMDAYEKMMSEEDVQVTDDAMVVEQYSGRKVKLVEGSYENIKITTPEDLDIGEIFAKKRMKKAMK